MRHVFFDLDGTLTDPVVGIVRSFQHALATVGGPSWDNVDLKQFIGPPFREVFRTLLGTDDSEQNERAIVAYRDRYGARGLYENTVYPHLFEALQDLRDAGFILSVVTSKPQVYADRIVEHFALRQFFARVFGAELSGERSEKADLLAYVLRTEAIKPADVCMVGDRRHDIEGARFHGMASVGVLWGYGSQAEFELAGADAIVHSPTNLAATIFRLSPSTGSVPLGVGS
jgi:phosphoglycolate phosphatase